MESSSISQSPSNRVEQKKSPQRGKFEKLLEDKEEEKEEAPLQDGPVSTSFRPTVFHEAYSSKGSQPVKIVAELTEIVAPKMQGISSGGISKTTISVQSEFLSELEIEIDHYDTDPSCFILTFRGDEKAQMLLMKHREALLTSLKGALPSIQCSIAPPTLLGRFSKKKPNSKNKLVKTSKVGYLPNNVGDRTYE